MRTLQLSVAKPCQENWDEMSLDGSGDQRVRFCHRCEKKVYNLSAYSQDEAENLIRTQESVCGRYLRRHDGTAIFGVCPATTTKVEETKPAFLFSAITTMVFMFVFLRCGAWFFHLAEPLLMKWRGHHVSEHLMGAIAIAPPSPPPGSFVPNSGVTGSNIPGTITEP